MYRLETTPDFDSDFKSLDSDVAERISKKLEWLSANPEALRFPLKHVPRDLNPTTQLDDLREPLCFAFSYGIDWMDAAVHLVTCRPFAQGPYPWTVAVGRHGVRPYVWAHHWS